MIVRLGTGPRHVPTTVREHLEACHERIRRFVDLARRAAEQAVRETEARAAAEDVVRYFSVAFPLHVADEEESLAPRLRGRSTDLDEALATMAGEHEAHARAVADLVAAARAVFDRPADPVLRRTLGDAAAAAAEHLDPHLSFEERTILPALDRLLDAEVEAAVLDEMRARRSHGRGFVPVPRGVDGTSS
ncbi:MAG: hemerythrin domain-containing protein [Deltaproteobacteria bacterium]|nr:MAG: hemerythrin domain-containing protein [Deltaproteobacteria bacterium]